jgi:cyclophilin family peptidyl-prolyl cis-trans isomerase/HEAT repeat protein
LKRHSFDVGRLQRRPALRGFICAVALLLLVQACAGRTRPAASPADDALLQRILVAEDARGTGPEGTKPLLEGLASKDSTLRYAAARAFGRLGWAPVTSTANRPFERRVPEECARIAPRVHADNPRTMLGAIDSLALCTPDASDDGTARIGTLRAIAATLDPRDVPRKRNGVSWHAAAHALVALAHAPGGARAAADLLPRFVAHPSPHVREYAAHAAAQLKLGAVLLQLAADADDNVRATAIAGLSQVGKHAYDSVYVAALAASGYQVVLAGATALAGATTPSAAPALLTSLDRLSAERRENSRDERMMILNRLAEFGAPGNAPRVERYLTDFDTTVAAKAASMLTRWTGKPVVAHAQPLPIHPEPLAQLFRTRGMQLRITMAKSSGGGTIVVRLFNDEAPATIARIVRLARAHYYDGLTFHRIVPGFVIQGSSPGANEYVGDASFMRDETAVRFHLRGTLGISTRGHDTGDAQFFVNLIDNRRLDHDYTVFGEIISGMDVVDQILEGDVMARVEIVGGKIPK